MQGSNRLFDDVARLFTDATGAAQGVRREAETMVKGQIERLIRDIDIATREEVDVLRDLVAALRSQNDALAARVSALETRLGAEAGSAGNRISKPARRLRRAPIAPARWDPTETQIRHPEGINRIWDERAVRTHPHGKARIRISLHRKHRWIAALPTADAGATL